MKALVFAFSDAESTSWSDRIAAQLERVGWRTILCDFSVEGGFDPKRLHRARSWSWIALSDRGFASIRRLSDRSYRRIFGDDLDFASICGLEFFARGYPLTREFLDLESPYYQRLRGIAARAEQLLRAIEPALLVVQQGSRPVPRILLARPCAWAFPGCAGSPHSSPVTCSWTPRDSTSCPATTNSISTGPGSAKRTWTRPKRRRPPGSSMPGWQTDRASIRSSPVPRSQPDWPPSSRPAAGRWSSFPCRCPRMPMSTTASAHALAWRTFTRPSRPACPTAGGPSSKTHPKARLAAGPRPGAQARVFVAGRSDIHDLIAAADVVVVFSSNVGMEALLLDKPVVVAGRPYYGGKGLTIDVRHKTELPDALRQALVWRCDSALRTRLVHYLIADYLVREGDDQAMQRRIGEAGSYPTAGDPARPFLACDPRPTLDYLAHIRAYDALAAGDMMAAQILARLGASSAGAAMPASPAAGEDRVASAWLTRIGPAHLARYAFAASVLPAGCRVLDFACGSGYGAYLLATTAQARVVAVDGAPEAIDYAMANWRHRKVRYRVASAHDDLPDDAAAAFDVIVCYETIAWLRQADALVARLWHRLRPGGVLFVSTVNGALRPVSDQSHTVDCLDLPTLSALLCGLPELATLQVFGQQGQRIDAHAPAAAEHLLGVAFKQPAGAPWALSPEALRRAVPFTHTAPAREFDGPIDVLRMLVRRRGWLLGLASRLAGRH